MKRLALIFMLWFLISLLPLSVSPNLPLGVYRAFALGTVTQALTPLGPGLRMITLTCTGDASNGTVPSTAIQWPLADYVFMVVTSPGTPAPTDDYDITLTDSDGVDVMGGEVLKRDEATTEQVVPRIGSVYGPRYVNGTLTLSISNQSVPSAVIVIRIYLSGGHSSTLKKMSVPVKVNDASDARKAVAAVKGRQCKWAFPPVPPVTEADEYREKFSHLAPFSGFPGGGSRPHCGVEDPPNFYQGRQSRWKRNILL